MVYRVVDGEDYKRGDLVIGGWCVGDEARLGR